MRSIGIMGVCLVAALATGAVAATSASAEELPALFECGKARRVEGKYTGHYTSKECTEASKVETGGKFELREGIGKGKGFKDKGGPASLEIPGLGPITCSKASSTGKFTGPKTAGSIVVTFTGCELLKVTCSDTGKAGEIKTKTLKGELGYISKEEHEVGIDLTPETDEYVADDVHCSTLTITVYGSVIGQVMPINEFRKTTTVTFAQSGGKQGIRHLEGMPDDTLYGYLESEPGWGWYTPDDIALSTEMTWKGERLELKA